jgi:recombinational DNA repair protein (RecF pathway)
MATHTKAARLFPLYLIYSGISPRNEAIARLTRAGWTFLQGSRASEFSTALFGADFLGIMEQEEIKKEIHDEVRAIMRSIFESYAFKQVAESQPKLDVS